MTLEELKIRRLSDTVTRTSCRKVAKKDTKLTLTLFESDTEKDKKLIIDTAETLWNDINRFSFLQVSY